MSVSIHKERILTVDDDTTFLEIIAYILEQMGYVVYKAKSGKEALSLFDQKKPDLVLCDLYMPEMSGLQLIKILKERSPVTPVVVISGEGKMEDAISALRLGAWDYIVKPFEQFSLEQTINRVVEKLRLIKENEKIKLQLEEKNALLTLGYEQLQADQKAAEAVQSKMLPPATMDFNNYTISYKMMPSLFLSGDFVDYFNVGSDKIVFYIADVSGHGASSAFVTVLLKKVITQLIANYHNHVDEIVLNPEQTLRFINEDLLNAKLGKYITMVYCVLDLITNQITYSVGGHYPSPIVWDGQKASFLTGEGYPVGVLRNVNYNRYSFLLPNEFTLLMPSDGVLEIMEGSDLVNKESKLLEMINRSQITVKDILAELKVYTDRGFPDDVTLFLINKKQPPSDKQLLN